MNRNPLTRLGKLILALFSYSLLLMILITVSNIPDDNPMLALFRPDPNCPQTCWHGMRPGITSIAEAKEILKHDPSMIINLTDQPDPNIVGWEMPAFPGIWASIIHLSGRPGNEVQSVRFDLNGSENFRLGNAMTLWGTPTNAVLFLCAGGDSNNGVASILFDGDIEVKTNTYFNDWHTATPAALHLNPQTPLVMVRYFADSYDLRWQWDRIPKSRWSGFRTWTIPEFLRGGSCLDW